MTERNIITTIIIIAVIICLAILLRYPPSFITYSPAAAGSFSTDSGYVYNPNFQGASAYNSYNGNYNGNYYQTAYPTSYQTSYPGYPTSSAYQYQTTTIGSYDDCVRAGYPVTGNDCRTPSGQVFTQNVTTTTTTTYTTPSVDQSQSNTIYTPSTYPTYPTYPANINTGACYVGGCNQELCSDQPNAVSACDYNPLKACFKQNSSCMRQADGQCEWTQTPGLLSCLGGTNS